MELGVIAVVAIVLVILAVYLRHSIPESLESKYLEAVKKERPTWFNSRESTAQLLDRFQDHLDEVAAALKLECEDPANAPGIMSHLLDECPRLFLSCHTLFVLREAQENGLLDEHYQPMPKSSWPTVQKTRHLTLVGNTGGGDTPRKARPVRIVR